MTDIQLYIQINALPKELKKEVNDFVEFLNLKTKSKKRIKQRKFGYSKGFFKMKSDFNKPLVDFKEYM